MTRSQKYTDLQISEAAKSHKTMQQAADSLGMQLSHFSLRAKKLGVYVTNQGRRGLVRTTAERSNTRIPLSEILAGYHPQYGTSTLKRRLLLEGGMMDECVLCGDASAKHSRILDHINGVNCDHRVENLRLVCPQCNAGLPTHAGRNRKKARAVTHELDMVAEILNGGSNRAILLDRGMTPNGANYRRLNRLRSIIDLVKEHAQLGESVDPGGSNPPAENACEFESRTEHQQ